MLAAVCVYKVMTHSSRWDGWQAGQSLTPVDNPSTDLGISCQHSQVDTSITGLSHRLEHVAPRIARLTQHLIALVTFRLASLQSKGQRLIKGKLKSWNQNCSRVRDQNCLNCLTSYNSKAAISYQQPFSLEPPVTLNSLDSWLWLPWMSRNTFPPAPMPPQPPPPPLAAGGETQHVAKVINSFAHSHKMRYSAHMKTACIIFVHTKCTNCEEKAQMCTPLQNTKNWNAEMWKTAVRWPNACQRMETHPCNKTTH